MTKAGGIVVGAAIINIIKNLEEVVTFKNMIDRINKQSNFLQKVKFENILHIGDKYKMDYQGPKELGINVLLLDRKNEYKSIDERIKLLKDLI